jgi:hypothetical protein
MVEMKKMIVFLLLFSLLAASAFAANPSAITLTTNSSGTTSGTVNARLGINISVGMIPVYLQSIGSIAVNCNYAFIQNASGDVIYSGLGLTFSTPFKLVNNTNYIIGCWNNGATYGCRGHSSGSYSQFNNFSQLINISQKASSLLYSCGGGTEYATNINQITVVAKNTSAILTASDPFSTISTYDAIVNQTVYNVTTSYVFFAESLPENNAAIPLNVTASTREPYYGYLESGRLNNITLALLNTIYALYYDEDTGAKITQQLNSTILNIDSGAQQTNTTTSGSLLFTSSSYAGQNTISTLGANYTNRAYNVALTLGNYALANIYLLSGTTASLPMLVLDQSTNLPLSGTIISQERYINGAWTQVASCLADLAGTCSLIYKSATSYRFTLSKDGYNQVIIYGNPPNSGGYTVRLTTNSGIAIGTDSYQVSYSYSPKVIRRADNQTITVSFSSPEGKLSLYSWTLQSSYNASNIYSGSGALANGQTFTTLANFSKEPVGTPIYLNLTYVYNNTFTNKYNFVLSVGNYSNTLIGNGDNPYNLSLIDRIIIISIILMLGAGIAYYFGGFEAGGLVGVFIFGYFIATGFINLYLGATAILFLFFVLAWRAQV